MMSLSERARLGGMATSQRYHERAERLRRLLAEGEPLKRAAWKAGMAYRTACRHRREWQR